MYTDVKRGVAGGAAPGYFHLQPPSPGGGLRVNTIKLRKQIAKQNIIEV